MTLAVRLIALLALVLMPFGMAAAPAALAVQDHSDAAMAMDDCPDQQSEDGIQRGASECAMPCSAALPATELAGADPLSSPRAPMPLVAERTLAGHVPEIATPPPKPS